MSADRPAFGRRDTERGPVERRPGERRRVERHTAAPASQVSSGDMLRATLMPGRLGNVKRETHEPDYVALVAVFALAAVGILMVYSASAIESYSTTADTFAKAGPQIVWALIGLVTMVVLMRVDYRRLRLISVPLLVLAAGLLILVLLPVGFSVKAAGYSARYLQFGPLPQIHPAEVAKLAIVVYLAHWLATRGLSITSFWRGAIPFAIITAPIIVLVAREPDLGTTAVIALTAFALFFVAGARLLHVVVALVGGSAAGIALMFAAGAYPADRIRALLDPWSEPLGSGYQTLKGLEALGVGGLFGVGLGNNRVNVPSDWNDFVFAVIAQEFGLVGGVIVIGLFLAFAYAGIRTALRAPDTFGGLLAAGITAWICLQALINIGVVVAVVPVTGITLPFVSAGGSSLVISFAAVGILLSISRETVERGSWNAVADRGGGYGRTHLPGSRRSSVATRPAGRS